MGKKGIPHRKFSKEEKMKYIRLHLDEHMPLRQIERECGIRNTLVAEWVKRYLTYFVPCREGKLQQIIR